MGRSPEGVSPASAKLGDTLTYTDDQQGVAAVITISALRVVKPVDYYTASGVLYQVSVSIVGNKGSYSANPLYFTARSADGDTYGPALGATSDQLTDGDVPAGQTLRGSVAFDVPKGQSIALVLLNNPLGAQLGSWHV